MSAYQFDEFERRMRRISRRHTKLSRGYTTEVNGDGLVVAKPQRKGNGTTLRVLVLFVVMLLLFKGFLHAQLGATTYEERVMQLAEGNAVERVGAWIMAADPVTRTLSYHMSSLVR